LLLFHGTVGGMGKGADHRRLGKRHEPAKPRLELDRRADQGSFAFTCTRISRTIIATSKIDRKFL
jgi:hypothetical protein